MRKINKPTTRTFISLIEKLDGKEYLALITEGEKTLHIEKGAEIKCHLGKGFLMSLSHRRELAGRESKEPEIWYLVIAADDNYTIYPVRYINDAEDAYEESVEVKDNSAIVINSHLQSTHCNISMDWLIEISKKGYLKRKGKKVRK